MDMNTTEKLIFARLLGAATDDNERIAAIDILLELHSHRAGAPPTIADAPPTIADAPPTIADAPPRRLWPGRTKTWTSKMSKGAVINILHCLTYYPDTTVDGIIERLAREFLQNTTHRQVWDTRQSYKDFLKFAADKPLMQKAALLREIVDITNARPYPKQGVAPTDDNTETRSTTNESA